MKSLICNRPCRYAPVGAIVGLMLTFTSWCPQVDASTSFCESAAQPPGGPSEIGLIREWIDQRPRFNRSDMAFRIQDALQAVRRVVTIRDAAQSLVRESESTEIVLGGFDSNGTLAKTPSGPSRLVDVVRVAALGNGEFEEFPDGRTLAQDFAVEMANTLWEAPEQVGWLGRATRDPRVRVLVAGADCDPAKMQAARAFLASALWSRRSVGAGQPLDLEFRRGPSGREWQEATGRWSTEEARGEHFPLYSLVQQAVEIIGNVPASAPTLGKHRTWVQILMTELDTGVPLPWMSQVSVGESGASYRRGFLDARPAKNSTK